jgi:hypothetical protein
VHDPPPVAETVLLDGDLAGRYHPAKEGVAELVPDLVAES